MKNILSILICILLITPSISFCEDQINSTIDPPIQEVDNSIEDAEIQQINQDEGYGADDEEYYQAEGESSENSEAPQDQE